MTAMTDPQSGNAPAGWYPDQTSPGTQRYWDGARWTEHSAPHAPSAPPAVAATPQKNWFLRHKVLSIGGAIVILLIAIGAATGGGAAQKPTADSTKKDFPPASSITPSPSLTSSVAPTTSKPVAVQPKVLLTLKGSGIKHSKMFTTKGAFTLHYSYNCAAFGFKGNFQVTVEQGADFPADVSVNELGRKGKDTTEVYVDAGRYHLSVNSECAWTITAVEGA